MICKNCGQENPEEYTFCQHCGKRLDGKKICPACGAKIDEEAKFCGYCGYEVKEGARVQPLQAAKSPEPRLSGKEKVKKAFEWTGVTLICLAALIGLTFTFLIAVDTTGVVQSQGAIIYDYFGKAYNDISVEDYYAYQNVILYMPNILGTVVAAGAILSSVTFAVLTALEAYKKFSKKRENTKFATFAAATYISFAVCATLFLALHAMDAKITQDSVSTSAAVVFSGATLAGLIAGGVALGGYYVCRFINNMHDYKEVKSIAATILALIVGCLAVVVIALSALPVVTCKYSNYVLAYKEEISAGFFGLSELSLSVIIEEAINARIAASCLAGYLSQVLTVIFLAVALVKSANASCNDGKGKLLIVFTAASLAFSIVNLVCAIVESNTIKDIMEVELEMGFALPIVLLVLSAVALILSIVYKFISAAKKTEEVQPETVS